MISRRKLFAFASAVAVSPKAVLSADAETPPVVEMVEEDLAYQMVSYPWRECGVSFGPLHKLLDDALRNHFDKACSDVKYSELWQQ